MLIVCLSVCLSLCQSVSLFLCRGWIHKDVLCRFGQLLSHLCNIWNSVYGTK